MLAEMKKKPYTGPQVVEEGSDDVLIKSDRSESESTDIEVNLVKAHDNYSKNFLNKILPELPTLPNGMKLLGVNEQSPLIDSGELFKMRVFRPDKPISTSEVFDDGCAIRYTNYSKLVNDVLIISKFKIESAIFKAGIMDDDQVGLKAIKWLYEAEDIANLTLRPFIEHKVEGKRCFKKFYSQY